MILLRPVDDLGLDFVCLESSGQIGSAVLSFSTRETGRSYVRRCLEDVGGDYRGDLWAHNGPGAVTRLVEELCGGRVKVAVCSGLTVLPESSFYPVHYGAWRDYFGDSNDVLRKVNASRGVHIWNKLSAGEKAKGGSVF